MKLLIVESPSKCKKIEEYLGPDYKCIATKGHIRTLKNLKSIKTKGNFEPTYEIDKTKMEHIDKIKSIIESYSHGTILLATDDDREGEAIAWHICQVFHLPLTTPRIIFHEITRPALLQAVSKPIALNMSLVFSQQTRQILDMIIGYKISPFLWKYLYNDKKKSLSAGRCQTPALRLVYEHEKSQQQLDTKYKTTATFFEPLYKFELDHDYLLEEDMFRFLQASIGFEYRLSIKPKKESISKSPRPLNTSSLLQSASSQLHYSPKYTMSLCQTLYQKGHITYMRTENTKYSQEFIKDACQYISKKWGDSYIGSTEMPLVSGPENPHEAIRCTHLEIEHIDDSEPLNTMYRFIRKITIESCMADAVYDVTKIAITAPEERMYLHTIEIPRFLGWKKFSLDSSFKGQQETETAKLFFFSSLSSKTKIRPNKIDSIVSVQRKQPHYTEASLIHTLEKLGIGRPSTFAMMVETIQEHGYVERKDIDGVKTKCLEFEWTADEGLVKIQQEKVFGQEKNKLVITSVGILTIEFLLKHFDTIFSYNYTKKMETLLDEVFSSGTATGEEDRKNLCKDCYEQIKECSTPLLNIEKKTYPIGEYELVFQGYGASLRRVLEDGTIEYKNVKKDVDIDLERLEGGDYTLEELMEIGEKNLGEYEGHPMFVKNGKYGPYVEWGKNRESIKGLLTGLGKTLESVTIDDVLSMIQLKKEEEEERGNSVRSRPKMPSIKTSNPNILRYITADLSIRKNTKTGKPYIFYRRADMSKPQFFSLGKFTTTYAECDLKVLKEWILTTYVKRCIKK
jgi:DNA topoisomerase-1